MEDRGSEKTKDPSPCPTSHGSLRGQFLSTGWYISPRDDGDGEAHSLIPKMSIRTIMIKAAPGSRGETDSGARLPAPTALHISH